MSEVQVRTIHLYNYFFIFTFFIFIVTYLYHASFLQFCRFATQQRHALLLYNGRYNDENDFIALEIINGQLVFSFSLGGPISKVSTYISSGVSDGQWHTAHIYYFNRVSKFLNYTKCCIYSQELKTRTRRATVFVLKLFCLIMKVL